VLESLSSFVEREAQAER